MKIAIIGTRNPDAAQIALAGMASTELSAAGHTIVTGGAPGTDTVAMQHCAPGKLWLCLPWLGFTRGNGPNDVVEVYSPRDHVLWTASVRKYHPNPDALTRGGFSLQARNYGISINSHLMLALPGVKDGGTGQGMRIAKDLGIALLVYRTGSARTPDEAVEIIRKAVAWAVTVK